MSDSTTPTKFDALLGAGSKVVGALTFNGPVQIDGEIEGELHAKDKLTIGESAVVKAKVIGGEILVKGTVQGDITAKRLFLKKPAKVSGNITCEMLSIEEGVIFEGKSTMGAGSVERHDRKETHQQEKRAGV
jgi:cytoskeletal protein CcmA (bactofilin family)